MRVTTTIQLDFADANLQEIATCYDLTLEEVVSQIQSGALSLDDIFDSAWRVEEQLNTRIVKGE